MDALAMAIAEVKAKVMQGNPAFSLEYSALSGQRWGNISEWETRLKVDGSGKATMTRRRGPGDTIQEPPGCYSGQLPETSMLSFLDILDSSGIQTFRTGAPGPWDPVDRLELLLGNRVFSYSWGFANPPAPLPMARLNNLLVDWTLTACPKAQWNLVLTADRIQCHGDKFIADLVLMNQGSRSISIVHPGSPGMEDPFCLELKYGEVQLEQEGFTPDPTDTFFAPLRFHPLPQVELVEIIPGKPFRLEFSSLIEGDAPRGREGKVSFKHYLLQESLAGVEIFNGALFTEEFQW